MILCQQLRYIFVTTTITTIYIMAKNEDINKFVKNVDNDSVRTITNIICDSKVECTD